MLGGNGGSATPSYKSMHAGGEVGSSTFLEITQTNIWVIRPPMPHVDFCSGHQHSNIHPTLKVKIDSVDCRAHRLTWPNLLPIT